ncbi:MAG TPA: 2,3-diaminopropionate biosynthesis protein SbnB [Pyrinomonadaceae bacterium]|jgi:ornithine cyclodeaminase
MRDGDMLILKGDEVLALLSGQELELMNIVRAAYLAHREGKSSLPHSVFLNFPDAPRNRIIALPAYLSDGFELAGLKWVSSFPRNSELRMDRASAVLILNSTQTGRPAAIMEGSIISAKRTAASAALAAQSLHPEESVKRLGLIGCGLINFETTRFLKAVYPGLNTLATFDLDVERARRFKAKCQDAWGEMDVEIASSVEAVFRSSSLISLATTAARPHVFDLEGCAPGTTILHISLRDLAPEVILSCDNIVDDVDHVCRAQTSVHLAEQLIGHRDFIRCTLADIVRGANRKRRDDGSISVFSPFGLGILDIAVGKLVYDLAVERRQGFFIESFLPDSWLDR